MEKIHSQCVQGHEAGIDTDHFPLLMLIRLKLKADYDKQTTKPKFTPCTDEQRIAFKSRLQANISSTHSHEQLVTCIRTAAEGTMTKKRPNPSRPFEYSQDTETLLDQKQKQQIREGANDTDPKDIRNHISKPI